MNSEERSRLLNVVTGAGFVVALAVVLVVVVGERSSGSSGADGAEEEAGAPRIGDHWHAPYEIYIGDRLQPPIAETLTQQGIHTHGDGVIHVHPHVVDAEGEGARLQNFFGDQGGRLTETELRIPGERETHRAGDPVDGQTAELRILRADSGIHPLGAGFADAIEVCNSLPEPTFDEVDPRYVPKDGDCIRIIFGETGS